MMSQDLLEKILKKIINDDKLQELIDFLIIYKKGSYIYPSVLKRQFNYSDKEIYKILSILEKEKIITMYYEVICDNCNKTIQFVQYYKDLEEYYYCENCESNINTMYSVKVVYKVEK